VLVGDAALGGISATVSAYESLLLRGHDVVALAMVDEPRRGNFGALKKLLGGAAAHRWGGELPFVPLPPCAPPPEGAGPGELL
jgi:dethiobiotin synthetase/adenosylmethionine--8-amino-7-oxononanoate aminotransferase